ncbi:PREDICTED: probable E3 ubiquitin ligase SUD1 [Camelina sativa]|uniref:Probable E3 ubiquitin ligase SUD1 n=1 Tax=Camelina sativa TaxID=90675 RepID=A0ABM1RBE5_CAMSA|nr:PREDICTED: probable E3 ubiquitin ligase SUD1 [Camelina sativa]
MSPNSASLCVGLLYSLMIVCFMTIVTILRMEVGDLNLMGFPDGVHAENFNLLLLQLQGVIGEVVKVLFKYTKILCDWYFYKLFYILGQPGRPVRFPPNAPLQEFGVIRRLLFFMDDDAFAGLAISVYVSILFVLIPFLIGWTVLATVGGSYLFGNSPVILGSIMMLSVSYAYFGFLFTLRHYSFPAIVRWFSLGFHFITVILPCLLWGFSVKACKNLFLVKDALVLCFKICVLPWMIGWWLEICTSPLFGTTISRRFEILSHFTLILRWWSGFCCLVIADSYRELIQKIIHKRAFWYLLDVTDPEYKITKLNFGYTFFVLASHGVLLVILAHLPIKAITRISPSFFPLDLWVTQEKPFFGAYSIYINLIRYGIEWLIDQNKPAIQIVIHNWITTVSSWLQLRDFLLVNPRGEGFHRADQNVRPMMEPRRPYDINRMFLLYTIAEGSVVIMHEYQNTEDEDHDQRDDRFLPRIALMLVLAALSLFLMSTAFMALPILAGRIFSHSISFIMLRFGVKHDGLLLIYISTCFVSDHIQKGRTDLLLKYILIRTRNGLFFTIWITVIPGLLGLLIDLMIIIPSRVPLNESAVYFLIQDWLIGVVVLHIWTFLTMFTPVSYFTTKAWRGKFERIRTVGINRLPSMWLLRDVIGSIVNTLLTTLSIPYLLAKALFPLLGYPQSINSAVERFIWPALLALITVWLMAKLTRHVIIYLHQMVFNERYLVGERVDNLTEEDVEQRIIIYGV